MAHPLLKSKGFKPRTGKVKQCKNCGKDFYQRPSLSMRPYCSPQCGFAQQKTNKPLNCEICGKEFYCSKSQQSLRNRKHCSVVCRGKSQEPKKVGVMIGHKKRTGLITKAQNTINKYVRLRDCAGEPGTNCISCGVWKEFALLDGGHFIATTSSAIRFDERNINAQCIRCNRYLSGNGRHYVKGMLTKYGQAVIDELEAREFETYKWVATELSEIIDTYKDKIARLT